MEPHPIPQNVTSFEFHLVGDMTLKQFLYLGTGLGTAYLLYATIFFSLPIIAVPLILLSSLLGVAFAFLPIYDRPFDHWVKAFFKAAYSPTKSSFKVKYNPKLKIDPNDPFLKNRLQLYLSSMGMSVNLWDKVIPPTLPTLPTLSTPPSIPSSAPLPTPKLPTQQELSNLVEMAKQAQVLQGKISDAEKLIKQMSTAGQTGETDQLSANLKNLLTQTEELYSKTSQMTQVTQNTSTNLPVERPKAVVIAPLPPKKTQMMLTSTPNVISGIVTDEAGNFVENVITIIHNKEGIPVRALKTNKLGQFAGATPLPLGVYTITLEKEGYSFLPLQITLDNSVITSLNISAKKIGGTA